MYKPTNKVFIGVDPGMNGGIALIKPEMDTDFIKVHRCPKTVNEMAGLFDACVGMANGSDNVVLFVEHVWTFPGDGRVGAFRFGYNYGLWKGIAGANEIEIYNIPPKRWQGSFDIPEKTYGRERKKWLKDHAEALFPNIKITFNTADAVLIANYAKECYYNEEMPESELGIGVIQ